MKINLPSPEGNNLRAVLVQAFETITRAFLRVVTQDEAAEQILIVAPNRQTYRITVSNTGTLVVTAL